MASALLAALLATPNAAPAQASPVRAYYDFVHWVAMGRLDLALEQFADDAVVIAGPGCTAALPCVGKAAIRERYLAALQTGRTPLPLSDQRFDGRRLRTHGETVSETVPHEGVTRLRGGHSFEFRDDRIAALRFEPDLDDPATAAFMARRAGEVAVARTLREPIDAK